MASWTACVLSDVMHTNVTVGTVSIGFMNRLIVDDVSVEDLNGKSLLKIARMSVSVDLLSLLHGGIDVPSAQLFGLNVRLYKDTPEAIPNYQFVLDAFKSDNKSNSGQMRLRVNSFIMRHANVSYDIVSEKTTPGIFNKDHISLQDVGMTVVLKTFAADSLNLGIKRLSAREGGSGLELENFQLKLEANERECVIPVFELRTANSLVKLDSVLVEYVDYARDGEYSYKTSMSDSYVCLSDFRGLLPALGDKDVVVSIGADISGGTKGVRVEHLLVNTEDEGFCLDMNAALDLLSSGENRMTADVRELRVSDSETTDFFFSLLEQETLADRMHCLGFVNFSGTLSKQGDAIKADGCLSSGAGDLDISFDSRSKRLFTGCIGSDRLDLSLVTGDNSLGIASFNINADGELVSNSIPEGMLYGTITGIDYLGYRYHNIAFDMRSENKMLDGCVTVNDNNLRLNASGTLSLDSANIGCNALVSVRDFSPNLLNLTDGFVGDSFDFDVAVRLDGENPDLAVGTILVDSVRICSADTVYVMEKLEISAEPTESGDRHIVVSGDVVEADIYGNMAYSQIPAFFKSQLSAYLPSLIHGGGRTEADFDFDIQLYDSDVLRHILNVDYVLEKPLHIWGRADSELSTMSLALDAPRFQYDGTRYDDLRLLCNNTDEKSDVSLSLLRRNQDETIRVNVEANAGDDKLAAKVRWKNTAVNSISGEISAVTTFEDSVGALNTNIYLQQSELLINDTVWHVHPAHIGLYKKEIHCNNVKIENNTQYIKVNGIVSENESDSIVADLSDLRLEYFLDLINFHSVEFKGRASGRAILSNIYVKPDVKAFLRVNDFHLQGGYLGTADISANWDEQVNGISINGHITDLDNSADDEILRVTDVQGYVSPGNNDINLLINVNNTNAGFLNGFLGGVFSDIKGSTNGYLRVVGPLSDINLVGNIVPDISMRLRATNVVYNISGDTVRLQPNKFVFDNIGIRDKKNNRGAINGIVEHGNLKNFSYKFNISMDNMICYDEHEFNSDKFYATVYANGNMQINGADGHPLNITANITPVKGSVFAYDAATPDVVLSSNFLEFRDRKDAELLEAGQKEEAEREFVTFGKYGEEAATVGVPLVPEVEHIGTNEADKDDYEYEGDIFMDLRISLTPDCEIKLRMDNTEDGYITTYGNASLRASYHNKGAFQLFGNYNITSGRYRLFLQELIFRDLAIQNGSEVKFNGNPFDANLHLICHHTLNSVPLSDLTASTAYIQNNKVKVICILDITGQLGNMNFKFNIDLPNVNDETKQLVHSMISSEEEMNMQIIYLLGVGRFYTNEFARANGDTNSSQAINSLISSTLSGQINQMLSSMMGDNRKWNFGAGFTTGERGWEDIDVEGMLSGSLLDDRLLINGNFGYRDNALTQTSNFVGDFDVRWRITEKGNTYIKAYNQMNDRYFTKATLNTQGIGISYQRSFESWRNLMKWKKREKESKSAEVKADSVK
ncbi:MAG: translocation/assembly module TamB [Bacteroides sp.]|nr:translocation/assembly module TamB [Roseburia sp.]MCM1346908.1 translocation/assembly module TamB [Bacteroides sp.]MCM1421440.1 translocation/assembly module TamB [Bacteroides sp.]